MKVDAMLNAKGRRIVTIHPSASIATAAHKLRLEKIGALVVSDDGDRLVGILSERDIVNGLVDFGPALLEREVSSIMTRTVRSTSPTADIGSVMAEMTRSRIRHLPVLDHGTLIGIISIGDVVKNRLEELEAEKNVLRDYVFAHGGM
jgi:CBS domain-containing protein